MLRSHLRKTVLTATALLATTLLLTSCQDGDAEGSGASDAPSVSESAAKGGADGGGAQDGQGSGGKVSGSWAGAVSYMAPGKYMVTRKGEAGQAFFTSEDTDIEGAGKICGDADGQAATPCSEDELEAAAKKGFGATVKLQAGVAVSIIEDHTDSDSGSGSGSGSDDDSGKSKASGLFTGTLGYMAPGKYILTKTFEGPDRSFFTATTTKINGAGIICGNPDGQSTKQCTEDELEAAAKKGDVIVVVDVKNGVAVAIDENHN
ncbi:hypothetical protein E6R18_14575 [Streptomyces sp. A1277]|uniref:hypothetical protein n=1 Tax=Streptomyces sp. A1277 TaxID=2563103 RepID=UPI0010A20048|nr:hypothetical protein [Streptomyces sp. A1277]THA32126.1 hypothetical protein E6R18_14575 [Streptomyces sp. A1277]